MFKTFKTIENDVLKTAGFLLVLGLAVGLWLGLWMGFNPQVHKQMTRNWNETTTFFAHIGTSISASAHKLESQFKSGAKTTSPSKKTTSQPTNTASRWISNTFTSLWKFLQKTWLGITANLHMK